MAKLNKKKNQFASDLSNSRSSVSLSTATSASTFTASSSTSAFNSPQSKTQQPEHTLENIDDSDAGNGVRNVRPSEKKTKKRDTDKQKRSAINNKTNKTGASLLSSLLLSLLSTDEFTRREVNIPSGVWAWLTDSRVISELPLQHDTIVDNLQRDKKRAQTSGLLPSPSSHEREQAPEQENQGVHMGHDEDDMEQTSAKRLKTLHAYDLTSRDWTTLSVLTTVTLCVRLWRISWPDEVVLDEAYMGRHVNGYTKNEFSFDPNPPLGKLILAGITSFTDYQGSFAFNEIGDIYPGSMPYVALRLVMALMGALCSPMAYVTLKAAGQSTAAALSAATLVAFDNALTANNRLFVLDAPLMFFVAATFMSWNMFIKQSPKPFTVVWWTWLLTTGVSMAGAVSTKLAGFSTLAAVGLLTVVNLWQLAREDSVNAKTWAKHAVARCMAFVLLPTLIYLVLFHIHFSLHIFQPNTTDSPHAEHDLNMLSIPYRESLIRKHFATEEEMFEYESDEVWSDIVYGSVIQLQSQYGNPAPYLHSFFKASPEGTRQQQLAGYAYPDLNTHWIVIRAATDDFESQEIPSRIQYLKNNDILRLRHVPTRKCLHSHDHPSVAESKNKNLREVTVYGGVSFDGDSNDWWVVEVIDDHSGHAVSRQDRKPVKALNTLIRLRHYSQGCYLSLSGKNLPQSWGEGRHEIVCRKQATINSRTTWRITMNDHDYLPMDTELARYPEMTFWKKFVEMHRMMLNNPDLMANDYQPSASRPWQWPLAQSMIPAWIGYKRQLTIVANPVVWLTGFLGVLTFMATKIMFMLREKRGYFEAGRVSELKNYHLSDATLYFVGWTTHFTPFIFIRRTLFMHHYFPALYLSILLASSLFSGFVGFLPRRFRFGILVALLVFTVSVFVRLSPVTYASHMSREHCQSIARLVNPSVDNNRLDCSKAPPSSAKTMSMTLLKSLVKMEKTAYSKHLEDASKATKTDSTNIAKNTGTPMENEQQNQPLKKALRPPQSKLLAEHSEIPESIRHQVRLSRVERKSKAPKLPMNFPPPDEALPMDNVFLTPYQRPPQRWNLDLEQAETEQTTIATEVQATNEEEEIEKEAEEGPASLLPESENVEHLQQQEAIPDVQQERQLHMDEAVLAQHDSSVRKQANSINDDAEVAAAVGVSEEDQIDQLLKAYRARDSAERRVPVAVARDHYGDLPGGPPPMPPSSNETNTKKHKDEQEGRKDQHMGQGLVLTAVSTGGLQMPGQYEGRPGYQVREKMMSNALQFAKIKNSHLRAETGLFGQNNNKRNRATTALSSTLAGPLRDEDRQALVEGLRRDYLKQLAKSQNSILSARSTSAQAAPVSIGNNSGDEEKSKAAQEKKKQQNSGQAAIQGAKNAGLITPEEEEQAHLAQQKQNLANHKAEEQEEETNLNIEDEDRSPPIYVGSAQELEKVLKQLQEEGVRAEVVRGTVTHMIEPLESPTSLEEEEQQQQVEEDPSRVDDNGRDDGNYEQGFVSDGENNDDEGQGELPPPIAVKNAEELASVLDQLAAEGIRAEVVRGTATRYVEPPSSVMETVEE